MLSWAEVAINAQPYLGGTRSYLGERNALNHLLFSLSHLLVASRQLYALFVHLEVNGLTRLFKRQGTRLAVESSKGSAVAILHVRIVYHNISATGRTFHALCKGIRSKIDVGHHATGFEAEPSWTLGQ